MWQAFVAVMRLYLPSPSCKRMTTAERQLPAKGAPLQMHATFQGDHSLSRAMTVMSLSFRKKSFFCSSLAWGVSVRWAMKRVSGPCTCLPDTDSSFTREVWSQVLMVTRQVHVSGRRTVWGNKVQHGGGQQRTETFGGL